MAFNRNHNILKIWLTKQSIIFFTILRFTATFKIWQTHFKKSKLTLNCWKKSSNLAKTSQSAMFIYFYAKGLLSHIISNKFRKSLVCILHQEPVKEKHIEIIWIRKFNFLLIFKGIKILLSSDEWLVVSFCADEPGSVFIFSLSRDTPFNIFTE